MQGFLQREKEENTDLQKFYRGFERAVLCRIGVIALHAQHVFTWDSRIIFPA
jgi:hypothetical protein